MRGFIKVQVTAKIYSSIFWPSNVRASTKLQKAFSQSQPWTITTYNTPHANIALQVRAYTDGDKVSETAWSQRISTDPDNTAILVGITVPIIILVLVLLAFVVLRKLHCAPCGKSGGHHGVGRDHPADLVGLSSFPVLFCVIFSVISLISPNILGGLDSGLHIDNKFDQPGRVAP